MNAFIIPVIACVLALSTVLLLARRNAFLFLKSISPLSASPGPVSKGRLAAGLAVLLMGCLFVLLLLVLSGQMNALRSAAF